MTKETLKKAMALHKEIQEAHKLLEDVVHADAIMIAHKSVSNRVAAQEISVTGQARLISALSHYIIALNRKLEAL